MPDRWMDERDRRWRERDWRRSEQYGRGDERRYEGEEERSWGGEDEDYPRSYSGAGQDDDYRGRGAQGYGYSGGESYGRGGAYRQPGEQGRYGAWRRTDERSSGWQNRDYSGVSPAMEQGEYEAERDAERYGGVGGPGRYAGRDRDAFADRRARGRFEQGYEGRMYSSGDQARGRSSDDRQRYGDDRGERWERSGREAGDFFRRAGERVASWFGAGESDEGRAEARGDYGRDRPRGFEGMGPKGYQRPDERINEETHERLTDDPWVDATNVSISVSGGEITLSGTVENREAKHRAERIVEDISGVRHVQNNLRVERGGVLTSPGSGYGDSVLQAQMREANADRGPRSAGGDTGKSR